jgi:hypothetical protein
VPTIEYHFWPDKVELSTGEMVTVREQLEPKQTVTLYFVDETRELHRAAPVLQDDYTIRFGDRVTIPYPPRWHTLPNNDPEFRDGAELFKGYAQWRPTQAREGSTVWVAITSPDGVRRVWFGGSLGFEVAGKKFPHVTDVRTHEDVDGVKVDGAAPRTIAVSVGCGCNGKGWHVA